MRGPALSFHPPSAPSCTACCPRIHGTPSKVRVSMRPHGLLLLLLVVVVVVVMLVQMALLVLPVLMGRTLPHVDGWGLRISMSVGVRVSGLGDPPPHRSSRTAAAAVCLLQGMSMALQLPTLAATGKTAEVWRGMRCF